MMRSVMRATALLGAAVLGACGSAVQPGTVRRVPAADGSALFVRTVGSGADTSLVIHGGPALDSEYLHQGLAGLERGRTLIFYDMRGRGRSDTLPQPVPTGRVSLDQDLRDLEGLIATLSLGRFNLIAHHYGSLLAVRYAGRHPERVKRVVLYGPHVLRPLYRFDLTSDPIDSLAMARLTADDLAGLAVSDPLEYCRRHWFMHLVPMEEPAVGPALQRAMCDVPSAAVRVRPAIAQQIADSLGTYDFRDSLIAVRAPLLLQMGDADSVSLFWATLYPALAPEGRIVTYRGSPLFPWVQHRAAVVRDAAEFLDGGWPKGARRPAVQTQRPRYNGR